MTVRNMEIAKNRYQENLVKGHLSNINLAGSVRNRGSSMIKTPLGLNSPKFNGETSHKSDYRWTIPKYQV